MAEGALLPPVIVRLMGDMTQLRGTLREARGQMAGTAGSMRQAGATAFAGAAKMGRSVSLIGVGVAAASVKMAGDFQAQTMVLHTAAGESLRGLETVRKGILNISAGTGTGIQNLTDGMYQIEKAGYRGADGLKVLQAAAQGAKEENASLDSVTNAMTSVMASYHLKASDSVRVMNGMKTAAGEGKMTMEQFASSLSTVLPIASANKISFEEVGGALATLTQHGTSAREGTQELASTIRSLAAPNNVAIQEMQRLGLSSTDVSTHLGKRGLTGTLDLLSQTVLTKMGHSGTVLLSAFNNTKQASANANQMLGLMDPQVRKVAQSYAKGSISLGDWRKAMKGMPADQANLAGQFGTFINKTHGFSDALKKGGPAAQTYTDAIKKMAGGAIGLNTTLQLTGENTDGFKERVKKVGDSFHHSSKDVEGWKETSKQLNTQIAQAKAKVHVLAIEIGSKLIPVVSAVIGFFAKHKDVTVALASVIGGVLALSVVAYAAKLTMSAGKAVLGFGKMGVGAAKAAGRVVQGFRSAQVAGSAFSGKAGSFGGALRKGFDGAVKAAKTAGGAVGDFAKSVGKVSTAAGKTAWTTLVKGIKGVGGAMKTAALNAAGLVRSMAAATLAAARSAIAWTAEKLALIGSAIAEKAAAIGQWALNVAMDANPIMIVVLAVVALVGAVIYAYNHFAWFRNGVKAAWSAIVGAAKAAWDWLKRAFSSIVDGLVWAYHGMVNTGKSVFSWVRALPGRIISFLAGLGGKLASQASKAWSSFKSSVVSKASEAITWVKGVPGKVKGALGNLGSLLLSAGKSLISGFISGIKAKVGEAYDAAKGVVSKIAGLFPHSPAKEGPFSGRGWTLHSGHALMDGLAEGITAGAPRAVTTMRGAAQATADAFAKTLGISSPSKVFRSLGIYVNEGLVDGLTASTARVKAATRRIETLLIQTYNKVADLKGSKGVSNKWVKSHEATIKHLEAYAKREDKALRSLAAKRDSVATKLKAAQKNLAALQKSWSDEVKSVAQGVMQGFSIVTEAPQEGFALSAQDVVNKMRDQMAKAVQFAAQLRALQKKGLSSDLIAQIAAAGVDQGGATATALAGASKGQIAEINKLQKTTQGAANSAGKAVADSMYGAGIKSAQGLVKGLQSQQKAIEKQMMKIATAMQKAIKRALGIKSPSTVFAAIGQWIPRGLAAGVAGGAHHATTAVNRLATSVAGAGEFSGSGLALAGGGGPVVHQQNTLHVTVEGQVLTERKLRDVVERSMLQLGMRNPQTYQQYKR
ncbi:phage tail tape measure protein [Streptomyces sp. NBC_00271]|uniref:phage tail tape measure protein n=1 Tax=Streptomyces sp. NBC_00271 TaxID=2975697 RepID=UPI002E2D935D|nr:phage tail tape measure protein [Streptomyces sp. NBC_00271]